MAGYTTDYTKAARRHWHVAEALPQTCRSVAGYLYGVAAECAVKAIMRDLAGYRNCLMTAEQTPTMRIYPHLAPLLKERIAGRAAAAGLAAFAAFAASGFLQHWNTDMRYSDGIAVSREQVDKWREDAERAVSHV